MNLKLLQQEGEPTPQTIDEILDRLIYPLSDEILVGGGRDVDESISKAKLSLKQKLLGMKGLEEEKVETYMGNNGPEEYDIQVGRNEARQQIKQEIEEIFK